MPVFVFQGLLRIHLLAGQNLIPKDNLMGGMVKGKSDPYVKINIGGETFTSQVIKGNLNPTWNEMYEVNNSVCIDSQYFCSSLTFCVCVLHR